MQGKARQGAYQGGAAAAMVRLSGATQQYSSNPRAGISLHMIHGYNK